MEVVLLTQVPFAVMLCSTPAWRVQFVNPTCGADNVRMKRAHGALDRAGRAVIAAVLYHTGCVTLARLAAESLASHADAFAASPSSSTSSTPSSSSSPQPAQFLVDAWDAGYKSRRFLASRFERGLTYTALAAGLLDTVSLLLELRPASEHDAAAGVTEVVVATRAGAVWSVVVGDGAGAAASTSAWKPLPVSVAVLPNYNARVSGCRGGAMGSVYVDFGWCRMVLC